MAQSNLLSAEVHGLTIEAGQNIIGNTISAHTVAFHHHGDNSDVGIALIPSSTVPFLPHPDFVGREDISQQIDELYSQGATRLALVGIGGIGKTQVAVQYAHKLRALNPSTWVFWIHSGSIGRIREDLQRAADRLQLSGRHDSSKVPWLVRNWLECNKQWLVILDNADNSRVFFADGLDSNDKSRQDQLFSGQAPLASYFPWTANGRVLITSRHGDMARRLAGDSIISVGCMSSLSSLLLLKKKLGERKDDGHYMELADALEHIPMAMTQAAALIRRRTPRMTIAEYLKRLNSNEESQIKLLKRAESDLSRDERSGLNSVLGTWQITFEQIRADRREAADLLSLLSLFDRQGIPVWLLRHYYRRRDPENDDVSSVSSLEDDEFEDDLTLLTESCLISNTKEDTSTPRISYEMHRLVQLSTRSWLAAHGQLDAWVLIFIKLLEAEFPVSAPETWPKCALLLPHVEGYERLKSDATNFDLWTETFSRAGRYCADVGKYNQAHRLEMSVLNARRQHLGVETEATLGSMVDCADVLRRQGHHDRAEELNRSALAGYEKLLGPDHPSTVASLNALAITLRDNEKLEETEQIFQKIFTREERAFGPSSKQAISALGNLALVLKERGNFEQAEEMHHRSLSGCKELYGEHHRTTLNAANNLGMALLERGKLGEAEETTRWALAGRKALLGQDHPQTLGSTANLSIVLEKQEKFEEAEGLHRRAFAGFKNTFGLEHAGSFQSAASLVVRLSDREKYDEIEGIYREFLAPGTQTSCLNHPWFRQILEITLLKACESGRMGLVQLIFSHEAAAKKLKSSVPDWLQTAARGGQILMVSFLLEERGMDVDARGSGLGFALHAAAYAGRGSVVQLLLAKGSKLNQLGTWNWTPLYAAVRGEHLDVVALLLKQGAEVDIGEADNWTPLNEAAMRGQGKMVELLLQAGADPHIASIHGHTPLHRAREHGHEEIAQMLLEAGAHDT